MATIVPVYGYEAVIQISEDGGTTFVAPAIINTTRALTFTTETESDELCDTDDQSLPAQMYRRVRVIDFSVEGAGMAQTDNLSYWADWATSGQVREVKMIVSDLTITGPMVLSKFSLSGERVKAMDFSCSLEQAGPITVTSTIIA